MKTQILNTSIIPIEYTKDHEDKALELKQHIENNIFLFKLLLIDYEKITFNNEYNINALHFSTLKNFKSEIQLLLSVWSKYIIETALDEKIKIKLLKALFQCELTKEGKINFSNDIESTRNSFYSLIAVLYYNEINQPQELVEFIFSPTETEKEIIFSWFKDKKRFDLLNELLKDQYKILIKTDDEETEHDPFLKNYMKEMNKILSSSYMNNMDILTDEDEKIKLPKLNQSELEQLCIEFLSYIDPSLKWLEEYNKLKKEDRIVFTSGPNINWECHGFPIKSLIYAPLENTIRDFVSLIHEFSHIISLSSLEGIKKYLPVATKEFPAIFFEMCAIEFLKEKGYSQEVIDILYKKRNTIVKENMEDVTPILDYLYQTQTEGPICYESEMKNISTLTKCLKTNAEDEEGKSKLYDVIIKNRVDKANISLLFSPHCIIGEYPYVMGKYLANKAFEKKDEDPTIIPTAIEITENLANETVISIIEKLGISADEFSAQAETVQYVKKQN